MDGIGIEPRVLIAGGAGYLGSVVRTHLTAQGYRCQILTRSPKQAGELAWDGKTVGDWKSSLEGAAAIINFSGASISKKWTESYRKAIITSRVEPASAIGLALAQCASPPPVWISGCAAGIYGDTGEAEATEEAPSGKGFLAHVCREWEAAVLEFETAGTRKVILRTGNMLGRGGGMLPILTRLASWCLGSAQGSGRQWVSWIHEMDFARTVLWAIENPVTGPINAVAPSPVRNARLMAELRRFKHRPWVPNAPAWAIRAVGSLGGPDPSLALMSSRVLPAKLIENGFAFEFPDVGPALRDLL
ncbi:MAG: TIGR01777 family oxidoreductase [Fimbriimonadaceae bacterium]